MRLVGAALLLALSAASAVADDAGPAAPRPTETHARVPLRVVRMLPDTHQALLFDRTKGTYVAVAAGQALDGFTVDDIDADEVTLLSDAGATVVLAAPARHRRVASRGSDADADADADADVDDAPPARRAPAPRIASAEPSPADPYAAAPSPSDGPQPSDPYADGIESVPAGALGTGADGVRVTSAASPATTPSASAAAPAVSATATLAGAAVPADATVPAPGTGPAAVPASGPAAATDPATGPATAAVPAAAAVPATAAATGPAAATVPAAATGAAAAAAAAAGPDAVAATGPATATGPVAVPAPAAGSAPTVPAASAPAAPASRPASDAAELAAIMTGSPAATAPAPAPGATVLPRADVTAALANFAALTRAIQGAFTGDGLRVDAVAANSLFARAGLEAGDVVTSVDGKPLRSLDDAADLYARASRARSVSAQVLRGGKPVALRVAIQ